MDMQYIIVDKLISFILERLPSNFNSFIYIQLLKEF